MPMKFETQKLLVNGYPHRKIINVEMLSSTEVPDEYKDNYPSIFINYKSLINPKIVVRHASGDNDILPKSIKVSEEKFQKIISTAREAGLILHEINKSNKKKYPGHYAEEKETIII